MIKPQTLKGFRDFLPQEKRKRDWVMKKIIEVFKRFGFEPLETPTLEYTSLLLGKYGNEADKLVYTFKDKGGRNVALRYDQTVPSARVLTQYQNDLPKYFRRYQIQNVFRADKPQKGRYREFTQCDIDIFGSTSSLADAEILACTYFAYKAIGYPTVILKINDRQTLFTTLNQFATEKVDVFSIIQSIDKLDKLSNEKITEELINKGLTEKSGKDAISTIKRAKPSSNLNEIMKSAIELGIPKKSLLFQPCIARGLDYYTGMIFEVTVPEYTVGSVGGGGRFDNLIKELSGIDMPAVGIAFGFDRMVEAADELKLIPTKNIGTQVLMTIFDKESLARSLQLAVQLRLAKIKTEVFPAVEKLDKQLKYADRKGISFAIIIGPDEIKKGKVQLKDLANGTQEELTIETVIEKLTNNK